MTTQQATSQDMDFLDKPVPKGRSLWKDAIQRLKRDKLSVFCFWIIIFYALMALAAFFGLIASPWDQELGVNYNPPTFDSIKTVFGTDIFGRSVFYKAIHGARVAMSVGLVSTLISIPVGIFFGALAGYFGGWIDDLIVWMYTTISSIPSIMLILAIAFVLGKGLTTVYIAIAATSWVSIARVIRGEFIKHKGRDYVTAASSIGATDFSRIFKHILPNVFHQVIISVSMLFQSSIKSEVILSYLGLGVQGQPSWGLMIDDGKLELARGVWWQLSAATLFMFVLLLAFNIFGDALRDALDPKLK